MKKLMRLWAALLCVAMLSLVSCGGGGSKTSSISKDSSDSDSFIDSDTSIDLEDSSDVETSTASTSTSSKKTTSKTPVYSLPTEVGDVKKSQYEEFGFSMKNFNVTNKTVKLYVGPGTDKSHMMSATEIPGSMELLKAYYGIEVELVNCGDYNDWYTKLAALSLSGQSPDVAMPLAESYPFDIVKNNIQPLDNYFDWNDAVWDKTRDIMKNMSWNDKHYHAVYNDGQFMRPLYYNPKIFKKNGLKTPRDYFEKDEWTWTKMRELAVELTQDTNNDGTIDQWGIGGSLFYDIPEVTGKQMVSVTGKKVSLNISDPVFAEAAQYIYDLSQNGKYKCGAEFSANNCDLFIAGTVAMDVGEHHRAWTTYKDLWSKGTIDVVPVPRMDKNKTPYKGGVPSSIVMFKNAKNIEGAKAFIWTYAYVNSDDYKNKVKAYQKAHNMDQETRAFLWADIPGLTQEQYNHITTTIWDNDYPSNPNYWIGWLGNGYDCGFQFCHTKQWSSIVNIYQKQFNANIENYTKILEGLTE